MRAPNQRVCTSWPLFHIQSERLECDESAIFTLHATAYCVFAPYGEYCTTAAHASVLYPSVRTHAVPHCGPVEKYARAISTAKRRDVYRAAFLFPLGGLAQRTLSPHTYGNARQLRFRVSHSRRGVVPFVNRGLGTRCKQSALWGAVWCLRERGGISREARPQGPVGMVGQRAGAVAHGSSFGWSGPPQRWPTCVSDPDTPQGRQR